MVAAVSMSNYNLEKEIEAFRKTGERLVDLLKQGDTAGIDEIAREHDEAFQRLVERGPFTNPDDSRLLMELKEAVDRTRESLQESREVLFSKILSSKKHRQCLKAYGNQY